jgi:ABC transporter
VQQLQRDQDHLLGLGARDGTRGQRVQQDPSEHLLVGPSGCGKTTALRMVAGLELTTSGTVSIGGRVVNDVSPRHRDVAMVFQNYALYPHLTVYQNIGFALANQKVPRLELDRRVRSAASVLGLTDRPARPQAAAAVRRAAAAGGDGPGHRALAFGFPDGRAAVQPGLQARGADALGGAPVA